MKKPTNIFILLLVSLLFSGCFGYTVATNSTPVNSRLHHKNYNFPTDWEKIEIYDQLDDDDKYEALARIIVTGNDFSSDERLLKKMKKEAALYRAEAILFVERRIIVREEVDGISSIINVINLVDDASTYDEKELDTGGEYEAVEFEGIAIKFIK